MGGLLVPAEWGGRTLANATEFVAVGTLLSVVAARFHAARRGVEGARDAAVSESAKLQAVFDAVPDGVVVADAAGHFTLVNQAQVRAFGFSARDDLTQTIDSVAPQWELSDDEGHVIAQHDWPVSRVLRGESLRNLQLQVRRLDTNQTWVVSYSGEPIFNARREVAMGALVSRDITDQRLKDTQLRETAQRYRAVFDQVAVGVAIIETETGRTLQVNARLAQLLGYTPEELVVIGWQGVTHPDDLAASLRGVQHMTATGAPFRTEKRYLKKNGSVVWVRLTINLVELNGVERAHIAIVEDITEQRRVAEQLQQAQKLESIGRLAGGVAHDFNNLLTVILSCGELLADEFSPGSASAEDVEQIRFAAERAKDLTRQLLSFARAQVIEPVCVRLNELIEGSQKMLTRLLGEDIDVQTTLAPGLWPVRADPASLNRC